LSNHRRQFIVRSVFRLADGSGGDHHYTLVSDPAHASGNCVIANWTTRRHLPRKDTSCILNRADHPAITDESLVYYEGAGLARAADVQQRINNGAFDISDVLLSEDAYMRLMLGFVKTSKVPIGVFEFLENEGFLPCAHAPGCWSASTQHPPGANCSFAACPVAARILRDSL
jgi:hypothetical protein